MVAQVHRVLMTITSPLLPSVPLLLSQIKVERGDSCATEGIAVNSPVQFIGSYRDMLSKLYVVLKIASMDGKAARDQGYEGAADRS